MNWMYTKKIGLFLMFIILSKWSYGQIVVGSYTGITQLSNISSSCVPIVNTLLGDVDFATNGGVEIPMGTTFSGTWFNGAAYSDGAGPEILCVSYHTEEWWDVELLLSDMSYTPAVNAAMIPIEDYITLDFWDCSGNPYTNFYYDRRVAELDFNQFVIPVGLTVIGARFTLTGDNAVNPDPIGILYIGGAASPTPGISNNGPLCLGETLELYADSVNGSTYNWIGPASFTSSQEDPIIVNVVAANAGVYTCYITDSLSNIDTAYTTVIINPDPIATFVLPNVCEFDLGNFSITAANDTLTNYHWDFGTAALNDTSNLANPQFSYGGGVYNISLTITSDEGCTDVIDTSIVIHLKPLATLSNSVICVGENEVFDPVVTADTTVSYSWTFPSGVPSTSIDSVPNINFPVAGNFNIGLIVTTDFGCMDTISSSLVVNGGSNPNFGVYPICISRFTFDPLPNSADSAWVVNWNMGDGTLFNNTDTSIFNYNYSNPGTYNVSMSIVDVWGCLDTVTIPVEVLDTISIVMPNILYHSSGINNNKVDLEVYQPGFNLCMNYTYTIYDRWGVMVFETNNDPYDPDLFCSRCFQGKSKTGSQLSAGVYYYVMKGNFNILDVGYITIFD